MDKSKHTVLWKDRRGSNGDSSSEICLNAVDEKTGLLDVKANQETAGEENLSTKYRVIKTVALCCLYFANGSFTEVTGPILPELVAQTQSSYENVMRAISMRGAGFVVGATAGGLTVDRWFEHIDLIMAGGILSFSAIGVGIGYVRDSATLFVMFLLQGALEQWFRTAAMRMAINLWKKRAAAALYATSFADGVAFVIIPKFVGMFVDPRFSGNGNTLSDTAKQTTHCNTSDQYILNSTLEIQGDNPTPKYPPDFVFALWTVGAIGTLLAAIFIAYYVYKRWHALQYIDCKNEDKDELLDTISKSFSPRSCSASQPTIAALLMISAFVYYGALMPPNRIFPKVIFSYARDAACMSVGRATSLQSTFFLLLATGRLLAFIISSTIHPKYIMQGTALLAISSVTVLYIAAENETALWIGVACMGLSIGPMVPGLYALLNSHIEMTAVAMIVPVLGGAIVDVGAMYFLGPDYEIYIGPKVIWTYMLYFTILLCSSIVFLQILCHIHGHRYQAGDKSKQ